MVAPQITSQQREIERLCDRFHVRRLYLFGSALRDDFDPARSDFDFAADFDDGYERGSFRQFFGFQVALEDLLGRNVDLVEIDAVDNPHFRKRLMDSRVLIYER